MSPTFRPRHSLLALAAAATVALAACGGSDEGSSGSGGSASAGLPKPKIMLEYPANEAEADGLLDAGEDEGRVDELTARVSGSSDDPGFHADPQRGGHQ